MKRYGTKLALGVIILLQILYTTYIFAYVKQGTHSDEVWSYGISNSYYQTYLDLRPGAYRLHATYADVINQEEWIPGRRMWDYITVQRGEQFAYRSVYENNTYDMHPPLYYMLLHTVCSFFPEHFSWWYGFALSLVFLVGTQVFLFLTSRKIAGSEQAALLVCLLYGGGKGAVCTFAYIRQYSLLVMLCMAFVYWSTCFYEKVIKEDVFSRKYQVLATVTAWLTFMTHYYGIVFIGIFTACFCAYLLLKRKWGEMLSYGLWLSVALVAFFALYPAAIYQMLMSQRDLVTAYSPAVQIRMLLCHLFMFNYGFEIGYFPTAFWNITLPLLGAGIVAVVALLIPFRDEPWFPKMLVKLKAGGLATISYLKCANYIPVFALTGCLAIYELVSHSVDVWLSGAFVLRYTSMAIPFVAMAVILALYMILTHIRKLRRAATGILFVVVVAVLVRVGVSTQYPYTHKQYCGHVNVLDETKGKNVLVVDRLSKSLLTDTTYFTAHLHQAEAVCFTSGQTIVDEFLYGGGYDGRRIDYVIADTEVFRLSEEEKRELETRDDITFGEEDPTQHPLACTQLIKEIAGNRAYEIMAVWQGQTGVYYILKFL